MSACLVIYLLFDIVVEAIKKIEDIKLRRQGTHIMQRLRKARALEEQRDIREVQRDLSLIRSPAAGKFFKGSWPFSRGKKEMH